MVSASRAKFFSRYSGVLVHSRTRSTSAAAHGFSNLLPLVGEHLLVFRAAEQVEMVEYVVGILAHGRFLCLSVFRRRPCD